MCIRDRCVCVCVCVCARARARVYALRIVSVDKILRFTDTLIIIIIKSLMLIRDVKETQNKQRKKRGLYFLFLRGMSVVNRHILLTISACKRTTKTETRVSRR